MNDAAAAAPGLLGRITLLDRYVGATALKTFGLVAAGLTAMFTLLDFVEQLATVGQGHYRFGDALAYVLLTAPNRLLQVAPVSMLLGSLLALGNLNRRTELTAFRCLGISETRIIGAVVKLVLPICLALLLLAEFVIPAAQRLAQDERASALAFAHADDSFWAYDSGQYLNIQRFSHGKALEDIDMFSFDKDGALTSFIHGERADLQPNGTWLLKDVVRKRVVEDLFQTDRLATLPWLPFVSANQMQLLRLPLDTMPPFELYEYVRHLRRADQPASRYEQELWARIALPVSMIAMITIAAPFVFGTSRARDLGYQIVVGAAIGIVFSLGQQITRHVGVLLDLSPPITALAPSILLAGLAFYLFRRTI